MLSLSTGGLNRRKSGQRLIGNLATHEAKKITSQSSLKLSDENP
jgi:hypothetical protein